MAWHIDIARAEVERLGVRPGAAVATDVPWGEPRLGFEVGEIDFTTSAEVLSDAETALDWAAIVATLARGVRA